MEETDVGVHQGNTQLIAGIDDHLISSRAGGGGNILHTTLKPYTVRQWSLLYAVHLNIGI